MNSIFLLTRLQVMQSLGGLRATIEKRTGPQGAITGVMLIGAALVGFLGWGGFKAYELLGSSPALSATVYNLLFTVVGALTFVFSLPMVLSSFFGSSDINDLLSLPVSELSISLSKALGALAASYLWTLLLVAGPLAGWGIASGAGLHYWVMYLLALVFTPFMPTAYAGTLAIIVASLFKRLRRRDTITTMTTVISLVLSVGLYFVSRTFSAGKGIDEALGGLSQTMGSVVMAFPAYGFAVYGLQHPDPLSCLFFVLVSMGAFAVFVLVARMLYMRIAMSLTSSGGHAAAFEGYQGQSSTAFSALARVEVYKLVRNSSVVLNFIVYPLVIIPIMIGMSVMGGNFNGIGEGVSKVPNLNSWLSGLAMPIVMFFALISVTSNRSASTAFSRDGSNWIHVKYIPVPLATQIRAKILPGFVVSAIIDTIVIVAASVALMVLMGMSPIVGISAWAISMACVWFFTCLGVWYDAKNPNVDWGNDGEVNVKNLKTTGLELVMIVIAILFSLPLVLTSPLVGLDPLVFGPVIAVVCAVATLVACRVLLAATERSVQMME